MMHRLVAVAALLAPALLAAQPATGAVRGVVFDSLSGAPVAGAAVQMAPAGNMADARTVLADSAGRFRFDTLPAGRWVAVFFHPALEALSLDAPLRVVDVRAGDTTAVTLGPPSGALLRGSLCPANAGDSTAALIGIARDARTGRPLDSGTVSLSWHEVRLSLERAQSTLRRVPAAVREGGQFLFCGVPTDADLVLRATARELESGDLDVDVKPAHVARLDVLLGTSQAAADGALRPRVQNGARLVGTVRDDHDRPVSGAHVLVLGVEGDALTDHTGTFHMEGMPPGSWTVEARSLGFQPSRAVASLPAGESGTVRIQLAQRVTKLGEVVIRGKASAVGLGMQEFLERKKLGLGRFMTAAEIDEKHPLFTTDVFQAVRSIRVVPKQYGDGYMLRGRAGCVPTVFINGFRIQGGANDLNDLLAPGDMAGVEIYDGGQAPAQYATPRVDGCEVVVIWRKL